MNPRKLSLWALVLILAAALSYSIFSGEDSEMEMQEYLKENNKQNIGGSL